MSFSNRITYIHVLCIMDLQLSVGRFDKSNQGFFFFDKNTHALKFDLISRTLIDIL